MSIPIKLIQKQQVAEGTMAFYFSKPEQFEYKSGQSIDLTIIDPPETDEEGNTRAFSLTSAPHEDFLSVATRMRDTAFKRVLGSMDEAGKLVIEGPFGSMTLHNDHTKPAVILAGGIGITPFYSMAKTAAHQKLPHKIFLFYSNRRPEDAAFLKELQSLQDVNPNFKLIATMTNMANSAAEWNSEEGYITQEMLRRYVPDVGNAIGYLAGPATMVSAMRKLFNEAGLNDDYIRSEEFTGYK